MFELFLYIGYSLLVIAVAALGSLWCQASDAEEEAGRQEHEVSKLREQNARLSTSLKDTTTELYQKNQRIAELDAALSAERDRARQKDASPWARDLPTSQRFELVQVPCEAVTLRAALDVPEYDLRDLTKVDLVRQLRAEVLKQAGEYVEVMKDCYDPCRMAERFVATLRVYKRRG